MPRRDDNMVVPMLFYICTRNIAGSINLKTNNEKKERRDQRSDLHRNKCTGGNRRTGANRAFDAVLA